MDRQTMVEEFKALISATSVRADAIVYTVTDNTYIRIYAFAIVVRGIYVERYELLSTGEVLMHNLVDRDNVEDFVITKIKA